MSGPSLLESFQIPSIAILFESNSYIFPLEIWLYLKYRISRESVPDHVISAFSSSKHFENFFWFHFSFRINHPRYIKNIGVLVISVRCSAISYYLKYWMLYVSTNRFCVKICLQERYNFTFWNDSLFILQSVQTTYVLSIHGPKNHIYTTLVNSPLLVEISQSPISIWSQGTGTTLAN